MMERGTRACVGATTPDQESGAGLRRHDVVDRRYVIERELARGGTSVVYLAHDEASRRRVALKLMISDLEVGRSMERVAEEARALGALRSPHVVGVHAAGAHQGTPYIAMEYVRGVTLESIVDAHRKRHDRMPLHRALTILVEIAQGLAAVHGAGLVHRDVKPGNVVIESESSRAVIVDFGLAELHGRQALLAGTPQYCAPEQFLGRAAAPTSDVYAFGVLAFELLTGKLPFEGRTVSEMLERHLLTDAPLASSVVPELAPLDPLVARTLDKSPSSRHQSADQLVEELTSARDTLFPPVSKRKSTAPKIMDRVLIADVDPEVRELARKAVLEAFFWNPPQVSLAEGVSHAALVALDTKPKLILLGHDPRSFDSLGMLRDLRGAAGGERARVIVMADDVTLASSRASFRSLGVRDFLSTPLALRRIVDVIREVTHRSGTFAAVTDQPSPFSDGSRQ